jgi:ABC-type dipeptide/oligopeptide/nickel transport system permease subunit
MVHLKIWYMTKINLEIRVTAIIFALMGGAAITWLSGFLRPLLPEKTVDVLQWGSPFPFLHKVVTFNGPVFVDWSMAAVDFVIWTIMLFIIIYVVWLSRCRE